MPAPYPPGNSIGRAPAETGREGFAYDSVVTSTRADTWVTPGASKGLWSVVTTHRYLLRRIVRKEMLVRYRGSILGWVWSYMKPTVQFLVFWLALGVGLGRNGAVTAYPIYLLSGIILLNFFTEAFGNATKSLPDNANLVQKIYLPRELFPVSSVLIALINFLPQVVVLVVVCLIFGWHPSLLSIVAIVCGVGIIGILATGLGLFFGAINVSFRDAQNFVDLILLVAMWGSPVLYNQSVFAQGPHWIEVVYNLNPVTPAVELMHQGFWGAVVSDQSQVIGFTWYTLIAFLSSVVILVVGQLVFRRLEGRFAQDL